MRTQSLLFLLCGALLASLAGIAHAQSTVTIGTGTTSNSNMAPIYRSSATSGFDYSRYYILYTASDLAGVPNGADVSDLEFYLDLGDTSPGATATLNLYLRNSTATSYSSSQTWDTTGATLVYSSTSQTLTAGGWVSFGTWAQNFTYTGGSIEVLVDWDISAYTAGSPTTDGFDWQYTARTGSSSNSQIAGGGGSSTVTSLSTSSSFNYGRLPNARFTYQLVDSVAVSGNAFSGVVVAGNTDEPVSSFAFDATNTSTQDVSDLTLTYTGTVAAADVTNITLWDDANNNGQVDTGESQLGTTAAAIAGGTVAFTGSPLLSVTPGTTEYVLVTADIAGTAGAGDTVSFSVNASTDVTASPGPVNGGYPADGGSATVEVPSVEVDGSSPTAGGTFGLSPSDDMPVLDFTLAPKINHQSVDAITVTNAGTMADADITEVKLWLDINNDGVADSGDVQIGGTQQFAGGTASFSNLSLAVNLGTTRDMLVTYSFTTSASGTIGCEINAASDVTNTPDAVLAPSGFPIGGVIGAVASATATLPYLEDFDQASVAANIATQTAAGDYPNTTAVGGAVTSATTTGNASVALQGTFSGITPNSGANMAVWTLNAGTTAGAMDFLFDLSAYNAASDQLEFRFAWVDDGIDGGTFANFDHVFVSNDGGQSWITSIAYLDPNGPQSVWNNVVVDLSDAMTTASAAYTGQMVIRIQFAESTTFEYAMVDDVELEVIAATAPTINAPLASGSGFPEILYYKFNEGTGTTTANDAVPGQGNNPVTLPSGTTPSWVTPGQLGASHLDFTPGNGVGLDTGYTAGLAATSDWTIETWVRRSNTGTGYVYRFQQSSFHRWYHTGGTYYIYGAGVSPSPSFTAAAVGTWQHVALVNDATAGEFRVYIDGVLDNTYNGNATGTGLLVVGAYSTTSTNWEGEMDEFRVWSQARSAGDISAQYQQEVTTLPSLQISGTAPSYTATVEQGGDLDVMFTADDINNDDLTYTVTVTGGSLTAAQAGFDQTFTAGVYNDPNPNTAPVHSLSLTGIADQLGTIDLQIDVTDGSFTTTIDLDITITTGSAIVRSADTSLPTMTAYGFNLPSPEEMITVQGYGLTADLVVTAPAEFEVSLTSGSGFASSVSITPTTGTVSPTDVFVRYNPSAAGPHSGTITATSTGANSIDIAVSGSIQAPIPSILAGPTAPATADSPVVITEVNLGNTDEIEIQNVSSVAFDATGWQLLISDSYTNINQVNGNTQTLGNMTAGEVQYWTDGGTNPWGSNMFWNPGTSSGWAMLIDDQGNVRDFVAWNWAAATIQGMSITAGGYSGLTPGAAWAGDGFSATSGDYYERTTDTNTATDWVGSGSSSAGTQNAGLTVTYNPAAAGYFAITGSSPNYTATAYVGDFLDITFEATDYNVQETLTFTITENGGTLTAATAGFNQTFTAGVYNDPAPGSTPHSLTLDGTAAQTGTLDLLVEISDGQFTSSYTVTVQIIDPPSMTVNGLPTQVMIAPTSGGPSPEQSFTVSGTFLQSDITVTVPADFEVSLTTVSGWAQSLSLTPTAGTITTTTVYVRYNPTSGTTATGDLTVATQGVTDVVSLLWGVVGTNPVVMTMDTPLSNFESAAIGTPSTEQMFTVLVANPVGPISVTAPTDFEISLSSGTGFTSSLTVNPGSTSQLAAVIFVRYIPAGPATTTTGTIDITTSGASPVSVAVNGEVAGSGSGGGGTGSGGGGGGGGGGGCVAGNGNTGMWGVLLGALALLLIALRVRAVRE